MHSGERLNRWVAAAGLVLGLTLAGACGSSSQPTGSTGPGPTSPGPTSPGPTGPAPGTSAAVTDVPGSTPTGDLAFLGPVRQVAANGITVGFRQFGRGPSLLLIVGQNSSMSYWGPDLPRRLADHYRVTMIDNRGVGYSTDQPDTPLTIELMADDTAAVIDALGLGAPAVFGWSTGGEIALALAVRHPAESGPVIVSGATAGGPTAVAAAPELDALVTSTDPAVQIRVLDHLFTPSGAAARDAYVAGLLRMPDEPISASIIARQAESEARFVRSTEVADSLGAITSPVLVTDGSDDQLVPVANAHLIAEQIPDARLELVTDTSHAWMMQVLDHFITMIVGFTDARSPG